MKVLSVNVGRPRNLTWNGHEVRTSIWKSPVGHRVRVVGDNLEGDEQSDLTVHGGPNKAVYAYPHEHYAFWQRELPLMELGMGGFGENLTTEGLLEHDARIGDVFRIGTAELEVKQPRLPCYKLGIRFDRGDMVKRFMQAGRSGIYFSVVREGELGEGDRIERIRRADHDVTIADLASLFAHNRGNLELFRRASRVAALTPYWREEIDRRLSAFGSQLSEEIPDGEGTVP
jgi:MOSC domain-containing protein YiiM